MTYTKNTIMLSFGQRGGRSVQNMCIPSAVLADVLARNLAFVFGRREGQAEGEFKVSKGNQARGWQSSTHFVGVEWVASGRACTDQGAQLDESSDPTKARLEVQERITAGPGGDAGPIPGFLLKDAAPDAVAAVLDSSTRLGKAFPGLADAVQALNRLGGQMPLAEKLEVMHAMSGAGRTHTGRRSVDQPQMQELPGTPTSRLEMAAAGVGSASPQDRLERQGAADKKRAYADVYTPFGQPHDCIVDINSSQGRRAGIHYKSFEGHASERAVLISKAIDWAKNQGIHITQFSDDGGFNLLERQGTSSDVKRVNQQKRRQALDFSDRVRPDGVMQGDGTLAPDWPAPTTRVLYPKHATTVEKTQAWLCRFPNALFALNHRIDKGAEFPDASSAVAALFDIDIRTLKKAYDDQWEHGKEPAACNDQRNALQGGADFYNEDGDFIVSFPYLVDGDYDMDGAEKAREIFRREFIEYKLE